MRWYGNLRIAVHHVGSKMKQNQRVFVSSYGSCANHFFPPGRHLLGRGLDFSPRVTGETVTEAFEGFFTSRNLFADSETSLMPISSPLTPISSSNVGKTGTAGIVKPSKVQAVLKGIRQNPKKVNLVAKLVRGMRVEDALLQLQVTVKRASKTVYKVIRSALGLSDSDSIRQPDPFNTLE